MMRNLNLKKIVGVLGVVALFSTVGVLSIAMAEKPVQKQEQLRQEVVVTTDKIKYKYGENIIIAVSNGLLENVSFFSPPLGRSVVIEKSLNGIWETLSIAYPFNGIEYLKKLKPGERINLKWDQTMNERGNWPQRIPVSRGKYRIKFTYYLKCSSSFPGFSVKGCEKHIIYSNEFIIKRKWF